MEELFKSSTMSSALEKMYVRVLAHISLLFCVWLHIISGNQYSRKKALNLSILDIGSLNVFNLLALSALSALTL